MCGMSNWYVLHQSTLRPCLRAKVSTKSRDSAIWNEYTHSERAMAFSRNGRSACGLWHPNGGFMTMVSAPSSTSLMSDNSKSTSAPRRSAFALAVSRAFCDASYPTTMPA